MFVGNVQTSCVVGFNDEILEIFLVLLLPPLNDRQINNYQGLIEGEIAVVFCIARQEKVCFVRKQAVLLIDRIFICPSKAFLRSLVTFHNKHHKFITC